MKNQGYICIVFDDGWMSDLTVGLQKQLNLGMNPKGTSFIIGSAVLGTNPARMHTDECKTLLDYGWDLQDHTYNHDLSGSGHGWDVKTGDEMRTELQQMNDLFVNTLHCPKPQHFSIPGGTITKKMMDIVGRERQTMMVGGSKFITPKTNRFLIPSFDISPTYNDTLHPTATRLDTIKKVIDDVASNGLSAVLYGHDLSDTDEANQYQAVLEYGLGKGCEFVTLSELHSIYRWKGYDSIEL